MDISVPIHLRPGNPSDFRALFSVVAEGIGTGRSSFDHPLPLRTKLRPRVLSRRWARAVRLARRGNKNDALMAGRNALRAAGGVEVIFPRFRDLGV